MDHAGDPGIFRSVTELFGGAPSERVFIFRSFAYALSGALCGPRVKALEKLDIGRIDLPLPELAQKCLIIEESLLVGILDIGGGVGDIVRRLQDKCERIALSPCARHSLDLSKKILLCLEISHLFIRDIHSFRIHLHGGAGIFDHRCEQAVSQIQSASVLGKMQLRHQPEPLRVALEMQEVIGLLPGQNVRHTSPAVNEPREMPHEPFPDGLLPEMSEGRISDIVDQAGALDDRCDILLGLQRKCGVEPSFNNALRDILRERSAD